MAPPPPQLPPDMIFEILTRTTLKTLDTCKCVSKEWKDQIEEDVPNFMSVHDQRNNTTIMSGVFVHYLSHGIPRLEYVRFNDDQSADTTNCNAAPPSTFVGELPRETKILASSKGILCCERRHKNSNYRYYVHKPTTGQCRALPNPKLRNPTAAVGMAVLGSNPLRFKIVRLSKRSGRNFDSRKYEFEIFDSTSWNWRRNAQTLTVPDGEFIYFSNGGACIFSRSCFHWQTDHNIIAFHEPTETFHVLPLPEQQPAAVNNEEDNSLRHYEKLLEFRGRVGLSRLVNEGKAIDLWIMEGDPTVADDHNKVEWRKHMSIDIGRFDEDFGTLYPVCFSEDIIVLMSSFGQMVRYRIKGSTSTVVVKLSSNIRTNDPFFQFRSDLENCSSMF